MTIREALAKGYKEYTDTDENRLVVLSDGKNEDVEMWVSEFGYEVKGQGRFYMDYLYGKELKRTTYEEYKLSWDKPSITALFLHY